LKEAFKVVWFLICVGVFVYAMVKNDLGLGGFAAVLLFTPWMTKRYTGGFGNIFRFFDDED